uniref:BACON domain-containing protein n=1 Tax=Solibacter usitatus (strain Ellin6076) TaxID=234267 RepID=Q01TB9_SOLUE
MKLKSALVGSILSLLVLGSLSSLGAQSLAVDKSSLSLSAQQGGAAVSQTLTVTGSSNGLAFSASSNASWLKVSPTSATTPTTLTVTADPTGLGLGAVQGSITIAGANSLIIPVTFTVSGVSGQTLTADKTSLAFIGQLAGAVTAAQTVTVSSATPGQPFTVQTNASWLKVSPTSGSTPTTLSVTADPTGLAAGTLNATLTISGINTIQIPVSFTIGSLGVSPQSIQFLYTLNGSFPTAQILSLTGNSVGFTASLSTTSGGSWLQVFPTTGTTPTTLSVIVNTAVLPNLAAGTYNGTITITPTNQAPIAVPVTLTVSGAPAVTVNPAALTFNFQTGQANPASQNVTVTVTPAQQLAYSVTGTVDSNVQGKNWIAVLPSGITSAQGTSTFAVSVDPSTLPVGTYTGKITIQSQGNPGTLTIPVTLVVSSLPLLNVPSAALNFTYQVGSGAPAAQPVTVTATSGTPNYTITAASTPAGWLKVSSAAGTVPTPFNVSVDPTGLGKGTYTGTVTVTGVGTGNGAQQIPVNLTVTNDPIITASLGGCAIPTLNCSLSIPFQIGGTNNPGATTLAVNSSTGATLSYTVTPATASCGGNWLLVNGSTSAASGTTASSVALSAATTGIAAGTTCTGTVTISATNVATGLATPNSPVTIPVTLTVSSAAQLVATPSLGYTFTVPVGGQASPSQPLNLTSTGTDQLNYAITFTPDLGGNWLSLNTTSGVTPGSVILTATPSNLLAVGTYTGTLKITATGPGGAAANATAAAPFTIPVVLTLTAGTLVVNPASLTFTQTLGGAAPANQTVQITSNGQPLNYVAVAANPGTVQWLTVSGTTTGQTPGSVTVAVDGSNLSAGTYNGTITVTAPGASNTPLTLPVTLTVAPGTISASPTSLNFSQVAGGTAPAAQSVAVSSTPASLHYTVSTATKDGGTWLSATPASGTTNSNVQVSVNAGSLAPGSYSGTVTITSAGAGGSPLSIPVTFSVTAAATLSASPASVTFNYISGTPNPAAQTVQVTSSGANAPFTVTSSTKDGATWLAATPTSGTTPATLSIQVTPANLAAGTYSGTVTVTSSSSLTPLLIPVNLTVTAIPAPVINAIGNAASYGVGAVSPGENIVIFGTNVGPTPLANGTVTAGAFTTTAGNTQVLFDGVAAPVLYASAGQTSVMVPYGVAGRATTTVVVSYQGVKSAGVTFNVVATSPGIYTLNQSGTGPGAILNQDLLTVPTPSTPAPKGSAVAVYMTGEGLTIGNADGAIATSLKSPVASVTATVGGVPAQVLYAGTSPGIVNGVMQVNVLIPAGAPSGNAVPIVITVGTASSQSGVTLAIQ